MNVTLRNKFLDLKKMNDNRICFFDKSVKDYLKKKIFI